MYMKGSEIKVSTGALKLTGLSVEGADVFPF